MEPIGDIISLASGDIGAIRVLVELLAKHDLDMILPTLVTHHISGPGIWVLYKDRCGCDIDTLADLLIRPPANLSETARG